MKYSHDIVKIAKKLLPKDLRGYRLSALISSVVKPLSSLNESLVSFVNKINIKIVYNSQVIYLEKLLNDLFDPVQRRINIVSSNITTDTKLTNLEEGITAVTIRNEEENTPPLYLFNEDDTFSREFDVNIPDSIKSKSAQISGYVSELKLADKRFAVVTTFDVLKAETTSFDTLRVQLSDKPVHLDFILNDNPFTVTVDGGNASPIVSVVYSKILLKHYLIISFTNADFLTGSSILLSYDPEVYPIRNSKYQVLNEVSDYAVTNNN